MTLAGDREKDAETAGNYHPSEFEKNMISRQAVCHPGFDSGFSRNILLISSLHNHISMLF